MGLLGALFSGLGKLGEPTKESIDRDIARLMAQKRGATDSQTKNFYQNQIDQLRIKKRYLK